ncbi:MAG TPA: very short patch repair endonuclease [Smithella sp.]|nr:very short patch repair endonuclease [Smithella sp.]
MDVFSEEKRSWIMSRVKNKNTKPEIIVRSIVHRLGYRFRKNNLNLQGRPDIVLTRHRKVIFVHGCFWHGHRQCKRATRPTTNKTFWAKKLDANIVRDKHNNKVLKSLGWKTLTIWECQIKNQDKLLSRLESFLKT